VRNLTYIHIFKIRETDYGSLNNKKAKMLSPEFLAFLSTNSTHDDCFPKFDHASILLDRE